MEDAEPLNDKEQITNKKKRSHSPGVESKLDKPLGDNKQRKERNNDKDQQKKPKSAIDVMLDRALGSGNNNDKKERKKEKKEKKKDKKKEKKNRKRDRDSYDNNEKKRDDRDFDRDKRDNRDNRDFGRDKRDYRDNRGNDRRGNDRDRRDYRYENRKGNRFNNNRNNSRNEIYDRQTKNFLPEKVDVKPEVDEKTEVYQIKIDADLQNLDEAIWKDPERSPLLTEERLLHGGFCSEQLILDLWKQKERIDSFFDSGGESFYYRARNSVFPQDQKGSNNFRNRAGDKLCEVDENVRIFMDREKGVFFDVCGGPGAWSEVLLNKTSWTGFGMTLKLGDTPLSDMWYKHLERNNRRWNALWGKDGTGNVYSRENLEDASKKIMEKLDDVNLVMGDGGFHISKDESGKHQEHLQEVYSARIILSELMACLLCLSEGGNFCCKMFDTFSSISASIVFVTALCFEECYIVKPYRSRIVNSERYLVGQRLKKKTSGQMEKLINRLSEIHGSWDLESERGQVVSLVPVELMLKDSSFFSSFGKQVEDLCKKQTIALRQVMDLAERFRTDAGQKAFENKKNVAEEKNIEENNVEPEPQNKKGKTEENDGDQPDYFDV